MSTTADENDQHDEPSVNDVPEGPPDLPAPPNETANLQKEPASVELEGERKSVASSDDACTSDEADASGASGHVGDGRMRPTKPRNASERVRERLERRGEENSPKLVPEAPDEPDGETAVPGDAHRIQERPTGVRTSASSKRTRYVEKPGQEVMRSCRRRREASKSIQTTETLSKAQNTMG